MTRSAPLHKTKSKPPFSKEATFIWSNLAFVSDDDDDERNGKCRPADNTRRDYFNMAVTEEEWRIREELALEIEKELEREIMEGLLVLVCRLSNLKAKQFVMRADVCASYLCGFCNGSRPSSPASQVSSVAGDYVHQQLSDLG